MYSESYCGAVTPSALWLAFHCLDSFVTPADINIDKLKVFVVATINSLKWTEHWDLYLNCHLGEVSVS